MLSTMMKDQTRLLLDEVLRVTFERPEDRERFRSSIRSTGRKKGVFVRNAILSALDREEAKEGTK